MDTSERACDAFAAAATAAAVLGETPCVGNVNNL